MSKRKPEYKPLYFTTTIRNPERIKPFLEVLKYYNNKILDNALINEISKELIKADLYTPAKISLEVKTKLNNGIPITDKEAQKIIEDNPQDHKEAGFDRGWASRFDTWFKITKELGFVYYEYGKKIEFSKAGLMLIDAEHPEFEQQVFLNAFVKLQSNNPFKRVLNENAPLILLLETIKKVNANKKYNGKGITRKEIPLVICWKNNNSEALYKQIVALREKYGYNPSNEVILDLCDKQLGGRHNSNKDDTIMQEYPDEFLRKMKLTGLITIRGFGRFIDINTKEIEKINYAIKSYSKYKKYNTERQYFDYISSIDYNLISLKVEAKIDIRIEHKLLIKWANYYKWEKVKDELLKLYYAQNSKDEILKFIPAPLRLEFLSSLAIVLKYPNIIVKPNYISDDEGLPSNHAIGGKPDIECEELRKYILIEVTMLTGTQQNIREMPSIARHLKERIEQKQDAISLFVAPIVFDDTLRFSKFIRQDEGLKIHTFSIKDFLEHIEKNKALYI
jgi:hypothetical protein